MLTAQRLARCPWSRRSTFDDPVFPLVIFKNAKAAADAGARAAAVKPVMEVRSRMSTLSRLNLADLLDDARATNLEPVAMTTRAWILREPAPFRLARPGHRGAAIPLPRVWGEATRL